MKTYKNYNFIKFLYDFLLTTSIFLIITFVIFYLNIFSEIDANSFKFLTICLYLIILIFRIISGYDNRIPKFLYLRDIFHGILDAKKIEKDYKLNKKMYDEKDVNTAHIKELNILMHNWINRLLVEFNNNKEHFSKELEEINNNINSYIKTLDSLNNKLNITNIKLKKKNSAAEIYYLTENKKEIETQIKEINDNKDEFIKRRNAIILEYQNSIILFEKERNIIMSDFDVRYKNYVNKAFKKVARKGYKYNTKKLDTFNITFTGLEGE